MANPPTGTTTPPTGTTTTVPAGGGATSNKFDTYVDGGATSTIENTGLPAGVTGGLYDLSTSPRYELNKMNPSVRDGLLKILFERGQYAGSKIGNGISNADEAAFAALLAYANTMNKSYGDAIPLYMREFPVKSSVVAGSGVRAPKQVSSPDDLKAVFKKASMDLLGRAVDDGVADHFVQSYQNQQIQTQTKMAVKGGGVVTQTPDAAVTAEKMLEQKFGQEVRVQNATNFGNIMDQMIKGLAR